MAKKDKLYATNAGLIRRILAFLIDVMILDFFVLGPFKALFRQSIPSMDFTEVYNALVQSEATIGKLYASAVFMAVIAVLYFSIAEWKIGQSIGCIILNIYVVGFAEKDRKGDSTLKGGISFWQSLARNLYLLPVFPFFLLWLIDPIMLFLNRNGQRLSEMLSRTKVVELHSLSSFSGTNFSMKPYN